MVTTTSRQLPVGRSLGVKTANDIQCMRISYIVTWEGYKNHLKVTKKS
jgi:hypothetical protein